MATMNRQIVLVARPEGLPKPSDFRLVETPMPEPAEGQFLVKTNYLSVDPYMRGRISEAKSYAEPVQIGQVMVGGTVGIGIAEVRANGKLIKAPRRQDHLGHGWKSRNWQGRRPRIGEDRCRGGSELPDTRC
jgi:hypothetical protein